MKKTILAVATMAILGGCVNQSLFDKQDAATLGGGLVGGLLCNQLWEGHGSRDTWTTICGAGGFFLGKYFYQQSNQALESTPTGKSVSWNDPDGSQVTLTPTNTFYEGNTPCREYQTTVLIDGRAEKLNGKACRQADGTWKSS